MKKLLLLILNVAVGTFAFAGDSLPANTQIPFTEKITKFGYDSQKVFTIGPASVTSDFPLVMQDGENYYRGRRQYVNEYYSSREYGGMIEDETYVEFHRERFLGHLSVWISSQLETCSEINVTPDKVISSTIKVGDYIWQVAEIQDVAHAQKPDKDDLYRVYQHCRVYYRFNKTTNVITALSQGSDVIMVPHSPEAMERMIHDIDRDYWMTYSNDFTNILLSFRDGAQ